MDQWQIMRQQIAKNPPPKALTYQQLCLKRWLVANVISAGLQYLGLILSTLLLPPSLLWFSAGVAVGLVFLRGYKVLAGIFLGSLAAYLWAGSSITFAILAAALHGLQTFALVWLCYKVRCYSLQFYQRQIFIKFLVISTIITGIVTLILAYSYIRQNDMALWPLWRFWWLADLNGLIIFSTALVTWDAYVPQIKALFAAASRWVILADFVVLSVAALIFSLSSYWLVALAIGLGILIFMLIRVTPQYHWPGRVMACFLVGFLLSLASLLNAPLFAHFADARYFMQWAILVFSLITLGMQKFARKKPSV